MSLAPLHLIELSKSWEQPPSPQLPDDKISDINHSTAELTTVKKDHKHHSHPLNLCENDPAVYNFVEFNIVNSLIHFVGLDIFDSWQLPSNQLIGFCVQIHNAHFDIAHNTIITSPNTDETYANTDVEIPVWWYFNLLNQSFACPSLTSPFPEASTTSLHSTRWQYRDMTSRWNRRLN